MELKKVMGHLVDGGWVDMTESPKLFLQEQFDQIVFTERLSRKEIKSIYPDLYEQEFPAPNR
jgi:hypothetical protein